MNLRLLTLGISKFPPRDEPCSSQIVTRISAARKRPEYTNHCYRVVEVGPLETICFDSSAQAGPLSQLPSNTSRQILNISNVGDSTTSISNLIQCSVTLEIKKCFLMYRGTSPVFQCVPTCPVTVHHWKEKRAWFYLCILPSGIHIH